MKRDITAMYQRLQQEYHNAIAITAFTDEGTTLYPNEPLSPFNELVLYNHHSQLKQIFDETGGFLVIVWNDGDTEATVKRFGSGSKRPVMLPLDRLRLTEKFVRGRDAAYDEKMKSLRAGLSANRAEYQAMLADAVMDPEERQRLQEEIMEIDRWFVQAQANEDAAKRAIAERYGPESK